MQCPSDSGEKDEHSLLHHLAKIESCFGRNGPSALQANFEHST